MKKIILKTLSLALSVLMLTASPVYALADNMPASTQAVYSAASQKTLINLKKNKVYTQYDFTGDGKKDKFQYSLTNEGKTNCKLTVTMNNRIVYTTSNANSYTLKLCTLSNRKVFLNITHEWNDSDWQKLNRLYQYKGGKFTLNTTLLTYSDKRYQIRRSDITAVKGNQITVTYSGVTNIVGNFYWNGIYQYNSSAGKLTRKSNIMAANYKMTTHPNSWIVSKPFNVYKKANSSERAFRTKAGEKVRINRVYSTNTKLYLEITRSNGARGWVNSPKHFPGTNWYFTNSQYAS